jgi:hypothetical protein
MQDCLDAVVEPENKLATATKLSDMFHIKYRVYRSGEPSMQMIEQQLGSIYQTLMFAPGTPFLEVFNDLIHKLTSAGIIEQWVKSYFHPAGKFKVNDKIGPQVLTMDHLEIGFLVCLIPLILSLAAFIAEISAGKVLKHLIWIKKMIFKAKTKIGNFKIKNMKLKRRTTTVKFKQVWAE